MTFAAGCNYGKMNFDDAVNPYQISLPAMPEGTVPVDGGIAIVRNTNPRDLHNPLPFNSDSVAHGGWVYKNFCIQCHGPQQHGDGTVGQSFAPMPADWHTSRVQDQSDGDLFVKISLGYLRMPPLYSTVAPEDRWYVIHFLRSVGKTR